MTGPSERVRFFPRCICCAQPSVTGEARLSRRSFVASGIATAGWGLADAAPSKAAAQEKRRIDVHHHIIPPAQAEALIANRGGTPAKWSPAMSLEDMDKAGV